MANSPKEGDRRHSGVSDAHLLKKNRHDLVRVAYGRTSSAGDELRAAEAALALHELDSREAEERQTEARTAQGTRDAAERRGRLIRSRVASVTGIAVTLGILAAVGISMLSPATPRNTSDAAGPIDLGHRAEAPIPTRAQATPATTAGAVAAELWFDDPQTDADVVVGLGSEEIDFSTTRAVRTGEEYWQLFIAKDLLGGFCLILREESMSGSIAVSCATPDDFTAAGLTLTAEGDTTLTAYWDGIDLRTEQPAPGLAQPPG